MPNRPIEPNSLCDFLVPNETFPIGATVSDLLDGLSAGLLEELLQNVQELRTEVESASVSSYTEIVSY